MTPIDHASDTPDAVPASLRDPVMIPVWDAVARRLERSGEDNRGRVRLPALPVRAKVVLGSLLDREPGAFVDLAALETGLVRLGVGADLGDALAALGSPVSSAPAARRAAQKQSEAARVAARAEVALPRWPELWALEWINDVIRAGILRDLDPDQAITLVRSVRAVLDRLAINVDTKTRVRDTGTDSDGDGDGSRQLFSRVELAASVLGDAHALDTGTRLEAATTRALRRLVADADADGRDAWERAGAHLDLVSGPVLTWALPLPAGSGLETITTAATRACVPVHLSQLALRQHPVEVAPGTIILVAENPRVVEAAAQRGVALPVVSSNGNPSHAGQLLLAQLLTSGATVRYHGDFDTAGLAICARMMALGLTPWRMNATDYIEAVRAAETAGVALPHDDGQVPPTPWDPELRLAFEQHRLAVHEERLLHLLLPR